MWSSKPLYQPTISDSLFDKAIFLDVTPSEFWIEK